MGFVKCSILPPKKLLIPILPVKIKGKLLFPFCQKCAEEKHLPKNFQHKDKERMIHGTWCISKVHQAVTDGYKIKHVTELLIYPEGERLFSQFVDKFYMLKQKYLVILKNANVSLMFPGLKLIPAR